MKLVDILPGIAIADLALYLKKENIAVIGDVHLGYEDAMRRQGVFMPRFQFADTVARLGKIFKLLGTDKKKLEALVINGDLKHDFGIISEQEWREILKLLDYILQHASQVILIKGNHDIKLAPIARKRGIVVVDDIAINATFICHGHEVPTSEEYKNSTLVIVGNEHAAVSFKDGARKEVYKCFISGTWKNKKLVVMPSFNQITTGTDILSEQFISPFMQQDLKDFDVFVVGEETYRFGKVKNL